MFQPIATFVWVNIAQSCLHMQRFKKKVSLVCEKFIEIEDKSLMDFDTSHF